MIGSLRGILLEKAPPHLLIEVQGVGYEVEAPLSTCDALGDIGSTVFLSIHHILREDTSQLFGFATPSARTLFRQLLKVSGIGGKTALGMLSAFSPETLVEAIATENVKVLSSAPGIGKKTAERLILELRGQFTLSSLSTEKNNALATPPVKNDIQSALSGLGYQDKEILPLLKTLPEGLSVDEGLRWALKNLMRY